MTKKPETRKQGYIIPDRADWPKVIKPTGADGMQRIRAIEKHKRELQRLEEVPKEKEEEEHLKGEA